MGRRDHSHSPRRKVVDTHLPWPAIARDDYLYCTVDAVFTESMPDRDGYSVKFAGARDS